MSSPGRGTASVDISVTLGPLHLKNPVVTASGTFGYGTEFADFFDLARLGGLVVKGLSPEPRQGHAPPRICETAAGLVNAIGLHNVGVEAFIAEKLPPLRGIDTAIIANVYGETVDEYVTVCRRLDSAGGVSAVELNASCPNTAKGGMHFGVDPSALGRLVEASRQATQLPLIVKLSPNVTDIRVPARAAVDAGADILSLVNTFTALCIDAETRRPVLSNRIGGLSGPAIKPLALHLVHEVAGAVDVPIMGMGGITSAVDAVEFMLAGAGAIQVGTANFVDPCRSADLVDELTAWCAAHDVRRVAELVGGLAES
ncbi:MAG: dihydroorotate dehydrogenase [Acidobacteriota bacterium]